MMMMAVSHSPFSSVRCHWIIISQGAGLSQTSTITHSSGHDMSCCHDVMLSCVLRVVWHRAVWEEPGSVIRVMHNKGAFIYHVSSRDGHHYWLIIIVLFTVRDQGTDDRNIWLKSVIWPSFFCHTSYENGGVPNNSTENVSCHKWFTPERNQPGTEDSGDRSDDNDVTCGSVPSWAGLGWAGLGWAGLGWAAGGKSNKSRYWGTTRSLDFVEFISRARWAGVEF